MRITTKQLGDAVRAAYVEGYIQGERHPERVSLFTKAQELAAMYWDIVEHRVNEGVFFKRDATRGHGHP